MTHPYPGAFTSLKGRRLFVWWGRPLAEPVRSGEVPGRIVAALPGEGLLVATAEGLFLLERAQWEGEPEFLGPVVATWSDLVGCRLE